MCFRLAPVFQRARIAEDETHRAVWRLVSTIRMSNHEACCNLLDVVVDLDRQSGLGGGPRYDRCPEAGRTARGFFVPAYASRSSDFETVPRERLGAGITRQTIHNANSTIAKWVFAKNVVIPLHHHLNEQITWITAGPVKVFSQGPALYGIRRASHRISRECPARIQGIGRWYGRNRHFHAGTANYIRPDARNHRCALGTASATSVRRASSTRYFRWMASMSCWRS